MTNNGSFLTLRPNQPSYAPARHPSANGIAWLCPRDPTPRSDTVAIDYFALPRDSERRDVVAPDSRFRPGAPKQHAPHRGHLAAPSWNAKASKGRTTAMRRV